MTPFLWLVATGYAVFMLTLDGVSIWTWLPERAARKAPARPVAARANRPARSFCGYGFHLWQEIARACGDLVMAPYRAMARLWLSLRRPANEPPPVRVLLAGRGQIGMS